MQTVEPPDNPSYTPTPVSANPPPTMTLNASLPVAPEAEQRQNRLPVILAILAVLLIISAVAAGTVYLTYVRPKVTLFNNSKLISESLPPLQKELKTINSSLDSMYEVITKQNQPTSDSKSTLLRLNVDGFISQLKKLNNPSQGEVAGASTTVDALNGPFQSFAAKLKTTYDYMVKTGGFGTTKQTLGESTVLESSRTTMLRRLKEYSKTGSSSVTNANTELSQLQNELSGMLNSNSNTELYSVLKGLSANNSKAQSYLIQASRTTSYYEKMARVQIKLEPMLTSYIALLKEVIQSSTPDLYIDRLTEIETTFSKIKKEIDDIPETEIPEGMGDLHDDNIKVCEILLNNIQLVRKSLVTRDYVAFLKNVMLLGQQVEPIATRATSSEISFWQDNKYLREGDSILKDYDKQNDAIKNIIRNNKVPYFAQP